MLAILKKLRTKVAIGYVGGSDMAKQQEQLGVGGQKGTIQSGKTMGKKQILMVYECYSHRHVRLLFC